MHYISLLLILAGIYTFWDSFRRGRSFFSSVLWGMGVMILFLVFFPLHLLTRPNIKKSHNHQGYYHNSSIDITDEVLMACPSCGKYYSGNPSNCPHCGLNLKDD